MKSAPLKYWSCEGSWLVPRAVMIGAVVLHLFLVGVDVLHGVIVAVRVLDIQAFEVGSPALVDPHVGFIRGRDGVAEPLVAALVDDDEVEARADADAGPVAVEIAVGEVVAIGDGALVLHAGVRDFD